MSLDQALMAYPSLHKKFEKAYFLYEEYIVNFPLIVYYLHAKLKGGTKKTILCYPEKPVYRHALYQICGFNGFTITNKVQKADAIIHFEDTTYRKNDPVLTELNKKHTVINYRCGDISKKTVDEFHKKTFGYGISVNPLTHKGIYVKKGDINSLHNGTILTKTERPEPGYVYQLLVNNRIGDELIEFRVPIIGGIPFVYVKHRPLDGRFKSKNKRVTITKPEDVFTPDEHKKILEFCRLIGLECGEMDVLRDSDTKQLYIIDVNNTPASPPYNLSMIAYRKALHLMSDAFQQAFLKNASNTGLSFIQRMMSLWLMVGELLERPYIGYV